MKVKKVPQSALMFQSPMDFEKIKDDENGVRTAKLKMTASSGKPFAHPYWGSLVFDYDGMAVKEKCPLDYCHNRNEVIGYASVAKKNGSLQMEGELISTKPGDRADDVMKKGAAGVPWESSISFDPWNGLAIEEYGEGTVVKVNGKNYSGPLVVFRQSMLRGVAICPYGADPYTQTKFSGDQPEEVELQISVFSGDDDMVKKAKPEAPEKLEAAPEKLEAPETPEKLEKAPEVKEAAPEADLKAPETPRDEILAGLKDYTTRFGAELGLEWFTESKPLIDCYADFVAKLATEHSAQIADSEGKATKFEAKAQELQQRLSQLGELAAGEQALSGSPVPSDEELASQKKVEDIERRGVTPGVAAFAAGLRLKPVEK